MKHRSWLHWKGGRNKISGQQMHAARTVLGQLQNMLRLGGATTGVLRRTLTDGTLIEAFSNAGLPSVRVTPPGGAEEEARTLISTMFVTMFDAGGVQAVAAAPAGEYKVLSPKSFAKRKGVGLAIPESYVLLDENADPVGLHASKDGKSVFVNNYVGSSVNFYDAFVEIDTKTYETVRVNYFDGGFSGTTYGGQWCSVSTDDRIFVGTLFGATSGQGGVVVLSRDPTAPFPFQLIDLSAYMIDVYALAIAPNGRYLFAGSFSVGFIVVIDVQALTVVGTMTFDGMDGADALDLSSDGTRLYAAGDHLDTGAIGQDRVISRFDIEYADDGTYVGATFMGKVRGGDPDGIKLAPNGKKLYASDGVNNFMIEYDVEQIPVMNNLVSDDGLTELTHPGRVKIAIPSHGDNILVPFRFDISPDSKYLYYPAGGTGDPTYERSVLVVSLTTYAIVAAVQFSGYPVAVVLSNETRDY